jgi:hypothetical protein
MVKKSPNKAEAEFIRKATAFGWDVNRRGWPDYWCVKGDQLILVEIKTNHRDSLKKPQDAIMRRLRGYGVWVYHWNPTTGFKRLKEGSKDVWEPTENPLYNL